MGLRLRGGVALPTPTLAPGPLLAGQGLGARPGHRGRPDGRGPLGWPVPSARSAWRAAMNGRRQPGRLLSAPGRCWGPGSCRCDGCVGGGGPSRRRRCQLAVLPGPAGARFAVARTARCRLAPCQPPAAAAAKCLSSSFPENWGLGEDVRGAWGVVAGRPWARCLVPGAGGAEVPGGMGGRGRGAVRSALPPRPPTAHGPGPGPLPGCLAHGVAWDAWLGGVVRAVLGLCPARLVLSVACWVTWLWQVRAVTEESPPCGPILSRLPRRPGQRAGWVGEGTWGPRGARGDGEAWAGHGRLLGPCAPSHRARLLGPGALAAAGGPALSSGAARSLLWWLGGAGPAPLQPGAGLLRGPQDPELPAVLPARQWSPGRVGTRTLQLRVPAQLDPQGCLPPSWLGS